MYTDPPAVFIEKKQRVCEQVSLKEQEKMFSGSCRAWSNLRLLESTVWIYKVFLTMEGLKGHPGLAVKENKQKNDNLHQKLNGS